MTRRTAKVDSNQPQMVRELREAGYHVTHIHTVGCGVPDLIVSGFGASGKCLALLVEVKVKGGKLTPDEIVWHSTYPCGGPLLTAYQSSEIINWFNTN